MSLACVEHGLSTFHGKGYDDLPEAILDAFKNSLIGNVDERSLRFSLKQIVSGLLLISPEVRQQVKSMSSSILEIAE